MTAEIICFKTPSLSAVSLAKRCEMITAGLLTLKMKVNTVTTIDCVPDVIATTLERATNRSHLVVLANGTGEISLPKDVCCRQINQHPLSNRMALQHLNDQVRKMNLTKDTRWVQSTLIPGSAKVFPDPYGPFCAFSMFFHSVHYVILPDRCHDIKGLLDELILPYIAGLYSLCYACVTIKVFGHTKERLEPMLLRSQHRHNFMAKMWEKDGICNIDFSAAGATQREADDYCKSAATYLQNNLQADVFEVGKRSLAQATVGALRTIGATVATAESCTGGMLSEMLTSVSGSSQILELGICAYSNRVKQEAIGVPEKILQTNGAISKETAAYLANGIRKMAGASLGVGITGVAGPDKSENKPVGTVFVALCDAHHTWIRSINMSETADRDEVRAYTTNVALDLLRRYAVFSPSVMPNYCQDGTLSTFSDQPQIPHPFDSFNALGQDSQIPDQNVSAFLVDVGSFSQPETSKAVTEPLVSDVPLFTDSDEEMPIHPQNDQVQQHNMPDFFTEEQPTHPIKASKKAKHKSPGKLWLIVTAVLMVATVGMILYFLGISNEGKIIKKAQTLYHSLGTAEAFSTFRAMNDDFRAWLNIGNDTVDLPVFVHEDNTYYSSHNMNGKRSHYGALYFDNKLSTDSPNSKNMVIYGLNQKDRSMFGCLSRYQSADFLRQNSIIRLTTADGVRYYQVFAILITNARAEDDNGQVFSFVRSSFSSASEFEQWKDELLQRSLYTSGQSLTQNDCLLALVTDSDAFKDARFVVVAKQFEPGDQSEVIYTANATPQYPAAWYKERQKQ